MSLEASTRRPTLMPGSWLLFQVKRKNGRCSNRCRRWPRNRCIPHRFRRCFGGSSGVTSCTYLAYLVMNGKLGGWERACGSRVVKRRPAGDRSVGASPSDTASPCLCRSCAPPTKRCERCSRNWSWCPRPPAAPSRCSWTPRTLEYRCSSARWTCWSARWNGSALELEEDQAGEEGYQALHSRRRRPSRRPKCWWRRRRRRPSGDK